MPNLKQLNGKSIALVMDGFINGLGIIRSLGIGKPSPFIVCIGYKGSAASYSKYVNLYIDCDNDNKLLNILKEINYSCNEVIPFPCKDKYFQLLIQNRETLNHFSIPWDSDNILDKNYQYNIAKLVDIDLPTQFEIRGSSDLESVKSNLKFPVIVKPNLLDSSIKSPFKAVITNSKSYLQQLCEKCWDKEANAIVAEYIPGDDTSLITYGGYAHNGSVLSGFTGNKISQKPKRRGVATIATSNDDQQVEKIAQRFIKNIKFTGIFQVEFKKHNVSGQYFFIEFNPRNWSWGYIATATGSNLPHIRYCTESNVAAESIQIQNEPKNHYYYFWLEGFLYNSVIDRWFFGVFKFFQLILLKKNHRMSPAIFSWNDIKPFGAYLKNLFFFAIKLRKTPR